MLDVIVIGGGPVGSRTAYKLVKMGHSVAVLEQRERLGERVCCTGIVSLESVRSFAIDYSLILRQINSARLFSPSGKMLYIKCKEPVACVLDRSALDVSMAQRAQQAGAEYLLGSKVNLVEVTADSVKVGVNQNGKVSNFEARAIVLAAGSGSRLMRGSVSGKACDFVMGAQAEVACTGIDEIQVYFGNKIAPGFFAWLVPTLPGKALVGLLSRHSTGSYLKRLLTSLESQGKIVSDGAELSYRGITLKSEARTYGNRLLTVGDAAGQTKPTTGGGIYYGLLCADIAAGCLHKALEKDDLSSENLASYEREWKDSLGQELTTGYYAREFYEHLSDRQIDNMFRLALACGFEESVMKEDGLSFDWHGKTIFKLLEHNIISRVMAVAGISRATEIIGQ